MATNENANAEKINESADTPAAPAPADIKAEKRAAWAKRMERFMRTVQRPSRKKMTTMSPCP